jgi:hypothetical protein
MVKDSGYRLHSINIFGIDNEQDARILAQDFYNKKLGFVRKAKNSYRFRIIPKTKFISKKYRTKKINDNVQLTYGQLKEEFIDKYPKTMEGEGLFDAVSSFFRGEKYYNNISKRTIEKYGNKLISKLSIYRTPVQKFAQGLLNVLTLGQFEKAKQKYNYDDVFHVALIARIENKNIVIEKNEVINISDSYPTNENTEVIDIDMKGKENKITLNDLLNGARQKMGDDLYFDYDGFNNNCGVFIKNILEASNLYSPEINKFLFQDAMGLLQELPGYSQPLAKIITRLGAFWNRLIGKSKNIKDIQKFTKDNEELRNIINDLVKLRGMGADETTYGEIMKIIKVIKKDFENQLKHSDIKTLTKGDFFKSFETKKEKDIIINAVQEATKPENILEKVEKKLENVADVQKVNKTEIKQTIKEEIKKEVIKDVKPEIKKEVKKDNIPMAKLDNLINNLVSDAFKEVKIDNKIKEEVDIVKNIDELEEENNKLEEERKNYENRIDTLNKKINKKVDLTNKQVLIKVLKMEEEKEDLINKLSLISKKIYENKTKINNLKKPSLIEQIIKNEEPEKKIIKNQEIIDAENKYNNLEKEYNKKKNEFLKLKANLTKAKEQGKKEEANQIKKELVKAETETDKLAWQFSYASQELEKKKKKQK